ncbi:hypothetical protein [Bacteroides sp.]|uniref:hypothetical protein n=1 Tax=Bacteroides sp. TaxID=29523 RepID=UPI002582F3A2|nr:hypothetical protein [Bacteroides sp.]
MIKFLPDDINIEDILSYLPKESYRVSVNGLHKRNSYKDIINYEETPDGKTEFHVGRNGLYNSLPEYMFHPINRFDNIPERERKERFAEEYAKQELEKENAHKFFSPIDVLLLDLKTKVKEKINQLSSDNIFIQNIIGDTLTEKEKSNRFIQRTIPFLPNCKRIRGNKTLITFMLRKVLFEEGLSLNKENIVSEIHDKEPQYNSKIEDFQLNSMYLGNEFSENIMTFTINYWSDEECSEHFNLFLEELETYRLFIKDYFFSIEDELCFHINSDYPTLRLADDIIYNYLNYNTNL